MRTALPSPKRRRSPQIFSPCLLWPNGWMDQDGTWHGVRPRPMPLCIRQGTNGRLSQLLLSSCFSSLGTECWDHDNNNSSSNVDISVCTSVCHEWTSSSCESGLSSSVLDIVSICLTHTHSWLTLPAAMHLTRLVISHFLDM